MITVEISPDSIAVDIDEEGRTVFLSEVPIDLEQVGIAIGTVCTAINDQPTYDFLAEGRLSCGEPMRWDFVVGGRSIRLMLVFTNEITPSVAAIEQAPASDAAEATSADFDDRPSEDWVPIGPEPAPEAIVDAPLFERQPVCLNLPEIPVGDHGHERVRPPRSIAYEWEGWGREPKEW
jgi:hypothetical protein